LYKDHHKLPTLASTLIAKIMCLSTASWVERNGHQYYNVIWNIHAPGIAGVGYVNDIIKEW